MGIPGLAGWRRVREELTHLLRLGHVHDAFTSDETREYSEAGYEFQLVLHKRASPQSNPSSDNLLERPHVLVC